MNWHGVAAARFPAGHGVVGGISRLQLSPVSQKPCPDRWPPRCTASALGPVLLPDRESQEPSCRCAGAMAGPTPGPGWRPPWSRSQERSIAGGRRLCSRLLLQGSDSIHAFPTQTEARGLQGVTFFPASFLAEAPPPELTNDIVVPQMPDYAEDKGTAAVLFSASQTVPGDSQ